VSLSTPWAPTYATAFSYKARRAVPKDLISVCVTNYNYASFVLTCLDSIERQTHSNLELIVVDDLSEKDDSVKIIAEWMRNHQRRFYSMKLVVHDRNQGPSLTRNTGFKNAISEHVFVIDADNEVYQRAIQRMYECMQDGGFDAVYSQIEEFGDRVGIGFADIWDPDEMRKNNYVDVMALVKRAAWRRVGGYSHIEEGWEDYDFWLKFIDLDLDVGYLPEVLCRYRVHGKSRTATEALSAHHNLELIMAFRHPLQVLPKR